MVGIIFTACESAAHAVHAKSTEHGHSFGALFKNFSKHSFLSEFHCTVTFLYKFKKILINNKRLGRKCVPILYGQTIMPVPSS